MFDAFLALVLVLMVCGIIASAPFVLGSVLYCVHLAGQGLMRRVWRRSPNWHGRD